MTFLYSASIAVANSNSPQKNKNSTRKRASVTLLNAVKFAGTTEKTVPQEEAAVAVVPQKDCMILYAPVADAKLRFLFNLLVIDLFIAEIASLT